MQKIPTSLLTEIRECFVLSPEYDSGKLDIRVESEVLVVFQRDSGLLTSLLYFQLRNSPSCIFEQGAGLLGILAPFGKTLPDSEVGHRSVELGDRFANRWIPWWVPWIPFWWGARYLLRLWHQRGLLRTRQLLRSRWRASCIGVSLR